MNRYLRRYRAACAFEQHIRFCRRELQSTTRTDHLAPVVDFLEWLLPECGPATLLTERYTRELTELKGLIHAKLRAKLDEKTGRGPVKAKPTLRLVK